MSSAIQGGDVLMMRVQGQLNEVTEIMKGNIEKLLTRGTKLVELEEKTEELLLESERFKSKSKRLRKAMWWKNAKFYIVGGVVLVVVASVVICKFQFSGHFFTFVSCFFSKI